MQFFFYVFYFATYFNKTFKIIHNLGAVVLDKEVPPWALIKDLRLVKWGTEVSIPFNSSLSRAAQHTSAPHSPSTWPPPSMLRRSQQHAAGNGDRTFLGGTLTKYSPEFLNMHMLWYIYFFFFFLLFLFYCSGFCHTLKWNSHGFTYVPHPDLN